MINFGSLISSMNIEQEAYLGAPNKAQVRKKTFTPDEPGNYLLRTDVDKVLFSLAAERTKLTKFSVCGLPSEQTQRVEIGIAEAINDMFGPTTVAYIDDRDEQIGLGNIVARTANMEVDDPDDNLAPVT